MFTFNLKKEWFEKIKNRQKTIEYRECKDYWFKRFRKIIEKDLNSQYTNISEIMPYTFRNPVYCIFRLGYTKTYLNGKITKIDIIDGMESDLKCKGSVFAIYFELEDEFDIDKAIDAMVYKNIFDKMNRLTAGKRIEEYDGFGNMRITEIINGQIIKHY